MKETNTVGEVLQRARRSLEARSETPYLDCQLLLEHVLERKREWILAHPEQALEPKQISAFTEALGRYLDGEALPYILGRWEFYGRRFHLNPSVLIPRPETELMVEEAIAYLKGRESDQIALDVGTGSGCVAITLVCEMRNLVVIATDVSWQALQVARTNARMHRVSDRIHLLQTDLMQSIAEKVDLVCANLPYIPTEVLSGLEVRKREPELALNGGKDGLVKIRRLLKDCRRIMNSGGRVLIEFGEDQGELIQQAVRVWMPLVEISLRNDAADRARLCVLGF